LNDHQRKKYESVVVVVHWFVVLRTRGSRGLVGEGGLRRGFDLLGGRGGDGLGSRSRGGNCFGNGLGSLLDLYFGRIKSDGGGSTRSSLLQKKRRRRSTG